MPTFNESVLSRLVKLEKRVAADRRASHLGKSSFVGSIDEKDADGNLVARTGQQDDGTHGSVVLAGPLPPTPSAPAVAAAPGLLTVTWDGTHVGSQPTPLDHLGIEVYAAPSAFSYIEEATLVGSLLGEDGDRITLAVDAGTWYVGLVAVTKAGRRSNVSGLVAAVVAEAASMEAVLASADGKSTVYHSPESPTTPAGGFREGDTWFETDSGNRIWRWSGTEWLAAEIGPDAIASAAITDAKIANLDAGKITTGTLAAARIASKSITADKVDVTSLTADSAFVGRVQAMGVVITDDDGGEVVNLTGDVQAITVRDSATGTARAVIDSTGAITGGTLNARDSLIVGGQNVMSLIDNAPKGVLDAAYMLDDMIYSTTPSRILHLTFTMPPTRRLLRFELQVSLDAASSSSVLEIRANQGNGVSTASSVRDIYQVPGDSSSLRAHRFMNLIDTASLDIAPGKTVTVGWFIRTNGGNGRVVTAGSTINPKFVTSATLEDLGAFTRYRAVAGWSDVSGGADGAPNVTQYEKTYTATAATTFYGNGARVGTGSQWYNVAGQGQSGSGTQGALRGMWLFPTSILSDLSGASINRVIFRVTNLHSNANSGLIGSFETHGSTGFPAAWTPGRSNQFDVSISKGATVDIDITGHGTVAAGLKSGAIRGIGCYISGTANYGYFSAGAQFIITYTK